VLERDAEMLLIRVPAEMIGEYLPKPQHLCGRRLPAGAGLAPSAAVMARGLWQRLEHGFAPQYEDCFAHHLLELIGTSYAMAFGADADSLLLIRDHIDDRLYDPGFKAGAIGSELGFGSRDVRELFAAGEETPRDYLLRRRLQEAARRLARPALARAHDRRGRALLRLRQQRGVHPLLPPALRPEPDRIRARAPATDGKTRRPVSISFDRAGARATLDGESAGTA
jgi:AraC-like DNA-binding protein